MSFPRILTEATEGVEVCALKSMETCDNLGLSETLEDFKQDVMSDLPCGGMPLLNMGRLCNSSKVGITLFFPGVTLYS